MAQRNYAAFISYSHADEAFASRLHKRIEAWRTPARLVGIPSRDGKVPARLFPVFRDREELPTSSDLGGVIHAALMHSRYLLVLCSPRAAQSQWVNQEILQFKQIHGEGKIIAAILEGEPDICFPDALKYRIGEDGTLTDERAEPIAADFRDGKDGWQLGCLKILAGMLAVNLDDLVQREATRRRNRRLMFGAMAGAVIALSGVVASKWVQAENHRAAQAELSRGLSALRIGTIAQGADHVLRAVDALGGKATPAQRALASSLRARLVPLEEAIAEMEHGTLTTWRGKTYLRTAEDMQELPATERFGWLDKQLIISNREQGVISFEGDHTSPIWTTPLADGERVCGLWADPQNNRIYLEGHRIGMTNGSSYGFHGWLTPDTGQFTRLGQALIYDEVCTGDTAPLLVGGNLARFDQTPTPLDWPTYRRESAMWEPGGFADPPPPHLAARDRKTISDLFAYNDDEPEPEFPMATMAFGHRVTHAYSCGAKWYAVDHGYIGNSGGEWVMCSGIGSDKSSIDCTSYDYIGGLNGFASAPDCSMTVAWGSGLTNRLGLTVALKDLQEGRIEGAEQTDIVHLGTFSHTGARFAATDGGGVVFVFEKTEDGLRRISAHDIGDYVAALTFLTDDTLAFITETGALSAINAKSGATRWPAIALGREIGAAVSEGETYFDPPRAVLRADKNGERLVLLAQVPEETAYQFHPHLIPTLPDGSPVAPTPDEYSSIALFFDATLGVAIGAPMSLAWTTGSELQEDVWSNARLSKDDAGHYVLSYQPYAAFHSRTEMPSSAALPDLTAMTEQGPMTQLP
ncbi:MAG: toll/interleukin-1 receptor domain-containing protein [Pikeienuella sp.]